jgi:cell division protein FtsW
MTDGENDKYFLIKQLQRVGIGIVIWIIFQAIDYRFWQKNSKYMLFATLFFLILPIFFGHDNDRSSTRWISIAGQQFQPSELAKLSLIFYLSSWLSSNKLDNSKTLPFFFIMGVVSFLMLMQKDFGTLSVMLGVSATMYIIAGASYINLVFGGGLAGLLFWIAIKLEPYRLERFTTFLNPESDTLGSGYHIRNALIAIGSGGLFGLGFGQSKQKYLYLPEAHTDSIFAIICEELGFIRALIIILFIAFVGVRGFRVAKNSPDMYSSLLATGITAWIIWQSFINIGAMLSILPLTGVPLPFISYGGSSLLILLAATGILINISKYGDYQK